MVVLHRIALLFTVLLSVCCVTGCEHKNPVAEYGNSLMDAHHRAQVGANQANLAVVRQAVEAYRAANDRFPERLEDAESFIGGNHADLSKYTYDPATGAVNLKP